MKVPIEVEGEEPMDKDEQATQAAAEQDVAEEPVAQEIDPDDEQALIDAAKRAGEEAAEKELAADASKIRAERDELQKKLADVEDQIEAAKKQATDASERLVRLQADWDNYRRRTATERLAEKERAAEKLVCALLPVLDDMERALDHAGNADGDDQMQSFVDGVSAVHDKMLDILAKEGVEPIDLTDQLATNGAATGTYDKDGATYVYQVSGEPGNWHASVHLEGVDAAPSAAAEAR